MDVQVADVPRETVPETEIVVGLLTPQHINAYWEQVGPLLQDVADTMHDHSLETLTAALVDPDVRFYIFGIVRDRKIVALVGVELLETAIKTRHLNIAFVSGQNPKRWIETAEPIILDWARSFGCTRATGMFHKAFKRLLPDWRYTHDYLELDL